MKKKMPIVWVLADDRAGNVNQLLGVAEALGWPYERKEVRYTSWVKLPNLLRGATLRGVTKDTAQGLKAPFPDLVLGAGRRMYPVARYIKKCSPKTKIVQLMNPGSAGFSEADLIVLPAHDAYNGHKKNVVRVLGTAHRVTQERLKKEKKKWSKIFARYADPFVSVIVGGTTKKQPFTEEMARDLAYKLLQMKAGAFLITTSRRTPKVVVDTLQKLLTKKKTYIYKYGDKAENPYFGLLACAQQIVVTGDSMSMCSEACGVGVPVFIFAPKSVMSAKHLRFHQQLYTKGYATELGSGQVVFGQILNPAAEIAQHITALW